MGGNVARCSIIFRVFNKIQVDIEACLTHFCGSYCSNGYCEVRFKHFLLHFNLGFSVILDKAFKIKNNKVKNILRGVMGVHDEPRAIMQAIRKIDNLKDEKSLKQSLVYIRTSNLFKFNGLTRHFNKTFPSRLIDLVDFSIGEVENIINKNSDELDKILQLYSQSIHFIVKKDFEKAIDTIVDIIAASGVSIALLRVLYFIYNRAEYFENKSDLLNKIDTIYKVICIDNIPDISKGIRKIIVDRADYFPICNKITNSDIPRNIKHILKTFIVHVPLDDAHYLEVLNAHLSFSLFDAVLYAHSMNKLGYPIKKLILPPQLELTLAELSELPMNISFYGNNAGENYDLSYFREAYLLVELDDNFRYKTIHGSHYSPPVERERIKRPYEKKLLKEYYKDLHSLNDLRISSEENQNINLIRYCAETSNFSENSAALTYYLSLVDGIISHEEEETFIKLMSFTSDVAYTVESEHLTTIKNRAVNQDLRMIALCLLVESTQNTCDLTEHEFRKRLQELIKTQHNENIVEALAKYRKISPSVTQYLVQTFDETFLSRLFDLNGTTNTALETRADILEWYGKAFSEQAALDRAKNIRIDIQIHKHIQHINDARIYADPTRVIAWINDNYIHKMVLALDEIVKVEKPNLNINWEKLNNAITPEYELGSIVALCYHEFVSNSLYGVSSYLGRRIRHGTVKGNAVSGVRNILNHSDYELLKLDPIFIDAWNSWIAGYKQVFEDLVLRYFHIQKKGSTPDGLLSPFINSDYKFKVANALIESLHESFKKIDNVSEAPVLIIEFCWRLIAEDLISVKRHLYKKKEQVSKFTILDRRQLKHPKLVQHFIQELQVVVGEKFKLIDSWFNKPSYASPSAELSLLYKVAIEDVQSKSDHFYPDIIEDKSDLVIYGEQYFSIFDALEIIIKNIAEHGDKNGQIKFTSKLEKNNNSSELLITTKSRFSKELSYESAKKIIEDKMASKVFSDANLVDKGSGIKKLRSMQAGNQISQLHFDYPVIEGEHHLEASFSIKLSH